MSFLATAALLTGLVSSSLHPQIGISRDNTCEGDGSSPTISLYDSDYLGVVPKKLSAPVPPYDIHPTWGAVLEDLDDHTDAGPRILWLVYNLPGGHRTFPPGADAQPYLLHGMQAKNDYGRSGYTAICPPPGQTHHYRLTTFVLSSGLGLRPRITARELLQSLRDGFYTGGVKVHVLETGSTDFTWHR